ncbi:hypothetical protein [Hyphomicrobium sp.]|uniref:hypothetical protein n=1 Tax=Hyphomicrobium sp. TaxID=82 RepID=UPI0025BBAFBF|nr:hypothetical protein [Hyphomicrobium sp.]
MSGIEDFAELGRMFGDAGKAIEGLDGELGTVSFDPHDPSSIEKAISDLERIIDERVGPHSNNALITQIVEDLKETYRQGILDQAAAARLNPE